MDITLGQPYSFCQRGQRPSQEDARYPDSDMPLAAKPFFLVCDGVGGSVCGELASNTVCNAFGRALSLFDWTQPFTMYDFGKALGKAYKALDNVANDSNSDMATTLAFAAFHQGGCLMAHIGDSRVYQIRPSSGILYRSEDHSLVTDLVRSGIISPDEEASHPQASTIIRYMCPTEHAEERYSATVCQTADLQDGDYILLCSDGVLDQVDEDILVDLVCSDSDDEQKVKELAEHCTMSQDNNTAILIPIVAVSGGSPVTELESPESMEAVTQRSSVRSFRVQDVSSKEESLSERIYSFIDKILN